jgi:hypothetical protein
MLDDPKMTSTVTTTRMSRARWLMLCVEWLFAATILVTGVMDVRFLLGEGYLPHPFFYNLDDTFMDWYNTVHWSYNRGAYDEWRTVYPPLSFVFVHIFSIPACYIDNSSMGERGCDYIGIWVLVSTIVANVIVSYLIFRRRDRWTAVPRTIALGLGLPMLFGLERGNLVLPCFTLLALASGRLLQSARLRWLCFGAVINLKPYLVLLLFGQFVKKRWRSLEGIAIATVGIYAVTFFIIGDGWPMDLVKNIVDFSQPPEQFSLHSMDYANTYDALMRFFKISPVPITSLIGSKPVEIITAFIPVFRAGGILAVLLCMAAAVVWPNTLTEVRLGGLTMALLLNLNSPGGYATIFLLFFVFQERSRSGAITITIIIAYLLSIPWDYEIVRLAKQTAQSYLTGRQVTESISVDVGELLRPGLLILVEYGLALASALEFARLFEASRRRRTDDALGAAPTAVRTG